MISVKEIRSLEPDMANSVIYGNFKNGKPFKLNIPLDLDFMAEYEKLKKAVYGKKEVEVVVKKKKRKNSVRAGSGRPLSCYTFQLEGEDRIMTESVVVERFGFDITNFIRSLRKTGRYRKMNFRFFNNGKELFPELKVEGRMISTWRCRITDKVLSTSGWMKELDVTKNEFDSRGRKGKLIKGHILEFAGKKIIKD